MKVKLLFVALLTPICFFGQTYDFESIQVNNLKILLNADGEIHRKPDESEFSEMPVGSGKKAVYNQHLWLGGIDALGTLRIAANTYKQSGQDFWPGPIANNYSGNYEVKYNKVWHLKKDDIESHRINYNNPGYAVPQDIQDWPGNGDASNGEAQNLAPYSDLNGNNVYEPELGDFPLIRGDEALFVIYNDMKEDHSETEGEKIGVEIHHMLYAFNNSADEFNNYTYYSHYEIFNRGDHSFSNFWVSNWVDFDLGYYLDDYIQTDVQRNMLMVFNGDSLDEGTSGYGTNPPAYGVTQLNEGLEFSMSYNNNSDIYNGNPNETSDFFNYMRARFGNGNQLINPDSNISNYIYPGNSIIENTLWDEVTVGHFPGDRRMLGTLELFDFDPGTSICLDFASVFAHDTTLNPQGQIGNLQSMVDEVQDFYDNQYTDCSDVSDLGVGDEVEINGNLITLIQENDLYYLNSESGFPENVKILITDVLGRVHNQVSLNSGADNQILATENLSKGVYFIALVGKSTLGSYKIVVE